MAEEKVIIEKAKVEVNATEIKGDTVKQQSLKPDTTFQQDLMFAGQRNINLIWEGTQAIVAIIITVAMVYVAVNQIESKELNYAFFLIVTMYFVRTNHTKTGGVGARPEGDYRR